VQDHIVIVGLMASGKTTVGAALATALGRPHRDSDADIERTTGRTARQIAADDGIEHLHDLELQHLVDATREASPNVVSAAASVIDAPGGVAALDAPGTEVVWLRAAPEMLKSRIDSDDHRPSPEPLELQADRRTPAFQAVADRVIDIDGRTPEAIVAEIMAGSLG
jgi:shikimate kinase